MHTTHWQHGAAAMALACAATLATPAAHATNISLAGNLVYNTDVVQIDFSLAASAAVTLWTDSWWAGLNFDPTLAVFNSSGGLLVVGDDTTDPAALLPGQGGYDSQIQLPSLAAGNYRLTLSASGNDAVGPTLADGFSLAGTAPVRVQDWNQPSHDINTNDQKGSAWQVRLQGVDQAAVVPEPTSLALTLLGLLGLLGRTAVARRQR